MKVMLLMTSYFSVDFLLQFFRAAPGALMLEATFLGANFKTNKPYYHGSAHKRAISFGPRYLKVYCGEVLALSAGHHFPQNYNSKCQAISKIYN